jgi:hypothetical protein
MTRELSPFAYADCYSCLGTGKIVGFGYTGQQCPCVAQCYHCDALIPQSDYDEGVPRRADGVPSCEACRTAIALEDNVTCS